MIEPELQLLIKQPMAETLQFQPSKRERRAQVRSRGGGDKTEIKKGKDERVLTRRRRKLARRNRKNAS